jgi:hypothetical protein
MAYLNANIPVEYAQIRREFSPYRLLFNVVFNRKMFHPKDLMNFNCGIVFLITLLLLLGIF